MGEYTQPEPESISIERLLSEVEGGRIKIPQFQREFVWTVDKSAKLLDSILKGYPIGTFIFWKTREALRTIRNVGNIDFKSTPKGDFTDFVLDGQQRITSLFAALKGSVVKVENVERNFKGIWIDLKAGRDVEIVVTEVPDGKSKNHIRFFDLWTGDLEFLANFPKGLHPRITQFKNMITSFRLPIVYVRDAKIDVATEIFTRINVTGTSLSIFEIMVAKTFSKERNFDLAEEYDRLKELLDEKGFGTIPPSTVLQVVAAILTKECRRKDILNLKRNEFIDVWPQAIDAIMKAIDFFRTQYRIPVSRLLPYNALVVPFSFYFFETKRRPVGRKAAYLEDFFWRASLGARYSASVETKLAQDLNKMEKIIKGQRPSYEWPVELTSDFLEENGYFQVGRSYIKAILCLMAYQRPKTLDSNSDVFLTNEWLQRANSKNYHHFFPRNYLKKNGTDDFYANHIVNITIVDEFLNKAVIRDKAPSKYISDFLAINPKLKTTLKKNHLIDLDRFKVMHDDYDTFFDKRCKLIVRELKKRIIEPEKERGNQQVNYEDREELII